MVSHLHQEGENKASWTVFLISKLRNRAGASEVSVFILVFGQASCPLLCLVSPTAVFFKLTFSRK